MSNNKTIRNRLNKLFEDIKQQPDDLTTPETPAPAEVKPVRKKPSQATQAKKPEAATTVATQPVKKNSAHTGSLSLPKENVTMTQTQAQGASTLSLPFQSGDAWNLIEIKDAPTRKWKEDEQNLVRQVVDQLTLALQNAQLFQQTERQNTDLEVLNAMGRELGTQFQIEQVAETIYKYTSQLMSTTSFFVALLNREQEEVSFPLVINGNKRTEVAKRKIGNGLTDYVLRNHAPVLLNGDIPAQAQAMGADVLLMGQGGAALSWLGVPLALGEKILGALVVQSTTTPNTYNERERDLLVAVASQSAIALQNAQLFQQTELQNMELAILNEMGRELTAQLNVSDIAGTVYKYTGQLMDVSDFFIAIHHPETDEISFPISYFDGKPQKLDKIAIGNGLTARVIHDKSPVFIPDNLEERARAMGIEIVHIADNNMAVCWMGVPLALGQNVLGAISLQSATTPNLYNEHHKDLLVAIASQASIALQNANLFEQAKKRAEEQALLNRIVGAVSRSLDIQQNLQTIATEVYEFFQVGHVSITTIAPDKKSFILVADAPAKEDHNILGMQIPMKGSASEKVLSLHEPMRFEDAQNNPFLNATREILKQRGTQEMWVLPILAGDDAVGTMALDITDPSQVISESAIRLLESIIIQTATAIQNSRLYQNMQVSETRFRDVALASADWVWEMDPFGNYTYCSDKVYDVLGYKPEEVLGKSPVALMASWEADRVGPYIQRMLLNKERMVDFENRSITKDGREVIVTSSGVPILDENGALLGYRGVNKDVTTQRLDQAIDDALAEITESSVTNPSLSSLFPSIHASIKKLIPAFNLYFGLYERETQMLSYPYKVDEADPTPWESHPLSNNLTSYLIRTGKPLFATPDVVQKLAEEQQIVSLGTPATYWLGVPLRAKEIIGVVAIQSYDQKIVLTEKHLDILARLSPQIATVIDKVRAEEALSTNRAQLSEALTLARMGYWEYDVAQQTYTMSDEVFSLLNTTADEMGGYMIHADRFAQEVVDLQYLDALYNLFQEAYNTEDPAFTGQTETRFKTRDDKFIWVFVRFRVQKNPSGQTIKLVGSAQDINTRKEAEEALRRQNEYLATATEVGRLITSTLDLSILFDRTVNLIRSRFSYYHVAIFTVDEAGMNATLREATGEAGDMMKRRQHSLAVGSKSVIGYVTAHGKTLVVNNTALDPNFRPNPLLPETRAEAAIPLKVGQRIIGALDIQARGVNAFLKDDIAILETLADQIAVALDNANSYERSQKAVEEMREIDRIKTQFLANMSHELRTPLNSIIGFSRVILKGIDGPVNEQQHQDLSAIYNSGQHLLGLINDILDHAKIEAGKMELSLEEVNPQDTIHGVMTTASGLFKDKPVRLEKQIEPDLPAIRADAMRVRQVLLNLISNASKFTDEGSVTVSAQTQVNSDGVREVVISVRDTGAGIAPEDQSKLFQAFSQVDSSPTRKTGGTGLGLSICRLLVEMHGGRIGVHSAVGVGSTFYFSIPTYEQPTQEAVSGEGKTILCIDDDPQVISLYERFLKQQGYTVVPVTNPATAKDAIRRIKPYAVTLDIMMPDIDGWRVLQEIKSDPSTRDVPVVICSIVEDEDKGFSLGASDYLVKPIMEDDLLAAISRLNADGSINSVLVIDDSEDDLRLVEKILNEKGGYKPILAKGGKEGWDAITAQHPSAIILDLFMPEVDGFEILERLRTDRSLREIPVLVISGMDLSVEQQQKLNSLGQRLLQKGNLREDDLFASLEKTIKRLNSQRRKEQR